MSTQSECGRRAVVMPFCGVNSKWSKGVFPRHSAVYRKGAVFAAEGIPGDLTEFFPVHMVLIDDFFAEVGQEIRICPAQEGRCKTGTFKVKEAGIDIHLVVEFVSAEMA